MGKGNRRFAIRRVVIEYGSIPTASWLPHMDSTTAIAQALTQMIEAGTVEGSRCELLAAETEQQDRTGSLH